MANRVGTGFSITVILNGRMFDSNDVMDLDFFMGMNDLPRGRFTLCVQNLPEFQLESGSYGMFVFLNTGIPDRDGKGFKFLVRETSQKYINEHSFSIQVAWEAGDEMILRETTEVMVGTSLDAMIDILKLYGSEMHYENRISAYAEDLTDTMTWRFVNSNMKDKLNAVVSRSSMNGDYMYWAYDDVSNSIIISSLNVESKNSPPQACIYSQNALNESSVSYIVDSNTGSKLWLYNQEERVNDRGNNLEKMFPNIIFSTVENGKASVSNCKAECFNNVMVKYGAKSTQDASKEYGITDESSVFGDSTIVNDFPLNMHKAYMIAPYVRERIISEYGKKILVGLYNNIGPSIGSRVYVRAINTSVSNGIDGGDDPYYTDEYIVGAKKVIKRNNMSSGALGAQRSDMNSDYITTLVLMSKSVGSNNYGAAAAALNDISVACGETIKG